MNQHTGTRSAIEAVSLSKRYGSTRAVDDLDVSIAHGVTGLLGPNGAGKTTLLRMLATVLAPDDGRLRVLGLDPARPGDRLEIRRNLGFLPQSPGLYSGFTAFDLVDYVAVLKEMTDRDERRDEVRRVLGAVGMTDIMHKRIRRMSGGMRQRVALAASLLGAPRLLVLDEPAAGLDPDARLQLRSVLSEAGAVGTVIVSTHQTAEVAAFCQRVLVMTAGRIVFSGAPAELADVAAGRVWIDDHAGSDAVRSWIAPDGTTRNIGEPPAGAELAEPTIDDGYLLLSERGGVGMTAATAGTVPAAVRPHLRRDAITALARTEAVRALRGPAFWISLAITAWTAWQGRNLDWQGGNYMSFYLGFTPLAAGIFVVGVLAGGRDRRRADRAPLAEEAALDGTDRAIARLLGLVPLVLIGAVLVIGTAIGSRIEGGFWIGNPPGRTDSAVHGVFEILLPILILVVGACVGVAAGRTFRHRTPVIVIGLVIWFLFFGAYWALQWAPAVYVVPTQVQPLEVTIDGNATDSSRFPADWLLDRPDEPGGEWTRVVVHDPLTAWHDMYLVGVAVLAAGIAIRSRTGRRLALIGVAVIGMGLVGQVAAMPHGSSDLEVPM